MQALPILYSFRRCPYAMRARMALVLAGITVVVREVKLSDKPQAMLKVSPKGTVPVLLLCDGGIIDESVDIMSFAAHIDKHNNWSWDKRHELVLHNDKVFTSNLRKYKYFERYPEYNQQTYRAECLPFIETLEECLENSHHLLGDSLSFVDIAVFPFIRQFAMVDSAWFSTCPYVNVRLWVNVLLNSYFFNKAMEKYSKWHPGATECYLPG